MGYPTYGPPSAQNAANYQRIKIETATRLNRIEPKRIRFVYPKMGKEANTLLIEGIKDGKPDLKVLPPLYVYEATNKYTAEVSEMLYGKQG